MIQIGTHCQFYVYSAVLLVHRGLLWREIIMCQNPYVDQALQEGFTKAVFLNPVSLECKPELRAFCNPEQCPNHGQNWVCPPACGTLEACREKAARFRQGLLVQSVTDLYPPVDAEVYQNLTREHNLRLRSLVEALKPEVDALLPLSTGGCVFCDACSYPNPCIHPEVKMESLSAFGIDTGELCKMARLSFSFRPDRLYLTALILLKTE